MKKIYSILFLCFATLFVTSCSNDLDEAKSRIGYLKLDLNTLVSTNTRVTDAPKDYAAKKLEVTIEGEGNDFTLTGYWENGQLSENLKDAIALEVGSYRITAHSAGWDGSNSGFETPFYYGETTVTVDANLIKPVSVTCTLANVKVTVNWDDNFKKYFKSALSTITSTIKDVTPRVFTMGEESRSAYFPVGDLSVQLSVINNNDKSFELTNEIAKVEARDHCIINYKVAEGAQAGITVTIDDETHTYTYDIQIPCEDEDNGDDEDVTFTTEVGSDDITGNSAILSGSIVGATQKEKLSLQYRQSNATDTRASYVGAEWITVGYEQMNIQETEEGFTFSYQLENLSTGTYEYKIGYGETYSEVKTFEIQAEEVSEEQLYNSGFELWVQEKRGSLAKCWYPSETGVNYWSSSNPGSASLGEKYNVTTQTTDAHSGQYAAQLKSAYILIKFAAASVFTGEFLKLNGTKGATLRWGVPFTSRPKSLKGYMKYTPGKINRGTAPKLDNVTVPAKNAPDECQIFCALLTEQIEVDNTNMATFPAWDGSDERIIAYGQLTSSETQSDWTVFNIPLTYYQENVKPSYIVVVASSSKFGDYFYGSDSSVLYLDDFELVY